MQGCAVKLGDGIFFRHFIEYNTSWQGVTTMSSDSREAPCLPVTISLTLETNTGTRTNQTGSLP